MAENGANKNGQQKWPKIAKIISFQKWLNMKPNCCQQSNPTDSMVL